MTEVYFISVRFSTLGVGTSDHGHSILGEKCYVDGITTAIEMVLVFLTEEFILNFISIEKKPVIRLFCL